MFLQRAIVTFTLGPLVVLLIYFGDHFGGLVYFAPVAVLLTLAGAEYVHLIRLCGWQLSQWLFLPLLWLMWGMAQWGQPEWQLATLFACLFAVLVTVLWGYEKEQSPTAVADWLAATGGLILLGWLGSHFFLVRGLPAYAWQWTAVAMVTTWVADSGAYVVGKFMAGRFGLGRHKFSPRLSPNKTVEGFVGGTLFALVFVVIISQFLKPLLFPLLLLGILVTLIGPLGDLSISLLKREAGIKDSGNLLPGHGGALDRVDSLLWTVTVAYYVALLLPHFHN